MAHSALVVSHLDDLVRRVPALGAVRVDVEAAYELLHASLSGGGTLYLCGNGGSAADCEHWSGELLKGFESKRPLDDAERGSVGEDLGGVLQGGIRAVPLTGFLGARTAMVNDIGGDYDFAQLVWALAREGDVVCCISTSGNSANLVHAANAARGRGARVLGLTGKDGGKLAGMCDVEVRVPAERTLEVQEMHLPVYHALALMLEDAFFGG